MQKKGNIEEKMNKIQNKKSDMATDLLRYVEAESRRKSNVIFVLILCWALTIGAFIWYLQMPTETVVLENDSGNASYVGNDMNGDVTYGEN